MMSGNSDSDSDSERERERERERDVVEPTPTPTPIPTLGLPLIPFDFFVSLKNNKMVLSDMRGNIVYYSTHFNNMNMAAAALLYDSSSTPLFSILPLPVGSWKGFKGDSEEEVMLSVNRTVNRLNKVKFKIKAGEKLNMSMRGCLFWRSCTIYEHNTIIAQTNLMYKLGFRKLFVSRTKFRLTLFPPFADFNLIAALLFIFLDGRR